MKKSIIICGILFGLLVVCTGAFACQITYTLIDSAGKAQEFTSGNTISLVKGETYTLRIDFDEDHRNCKVPPDQTAFLLNDRIWEYGKTNLPLQLLEPAKWQIVSSRSNIGTLQFKAVQSGSYSLEILRECTKEGYEGVLRLTIT